MRILKIENPEWEEISIYRYTEKENIGGEMQFLKQISQLLQKTFDAEHFIKTESEIHEKELELFFKTAQLRNQNIFAIKCFETDWNLKEYIIETEDYYIYKSWETTA